MIKCPNCGGVLKYNIAGKNVKCDHCGSTFDPEQQIAPSKIAGEQANLNGKVYSCSQCGASLMAFDETAITFCSYCGSQAMIESKMIVQNNPDFIIPFAKTKEECIQKFKNKVNRSLFIPSYMKSDLVVEKFRGIYMPYCIYKLEYQGPRTEKGSKYSHRTGDYQYYNDYTINFDVDAKYEGFSYDLASKLYDKYSEAIPFQEKEKLPYNPNYMLGFYADAKDVSGDVYLKDAIDEAAKDYRRKVLSNREVSKYGCGSASISFDKTEQKIGMFPLYFLAIRNKNQENIHYAVVNGQTGDLVTELPVSYTKYVIGSLIISAIIFLLINSKLVLNPGEVCLAAIGLAIIGIIINAVQSNALKNRETHSDDLGLMAVATPKQASTKGSKLTIVVQIFALLLPIAMLALNPIDDIYYYEAAVVSLALLLVSFYEIIKRHNILVSSKLPQLEKRGGDESA